MDYVKNLLLQEIILDGAKEQSIALLAKDKKFKKNVKCFNCGEEMPK